MTIRRSLVHGRWSRSCYFVFALLAACPVSAAALCAPTQRSVFSCSTGTKTISVCASEGLNATAGMLQYRFGRPEAAELIYPPADAEWRMVTRGGTLVFSGGGGAYVVFIRTPYRYVVYSAVGRGWGSKAGVVVERNGRRVANLMCKGEAASELGPDLFSTAGIEDADDSFELP